MGYEVEIHVGKFDADVLGGRRGWLQEIATVDICKPGYDSHIYQQSQRADGPPAFYFASNGNDHIEEDRYGKSLVAIPLDAVIRALEHDASQSTYPRFHIALATLYAVKEYYPDAVVVLFGY